MTLLAFHVQIVSVCRVSVRVQLFSETNSKDVVGDLSAHYMEHNLAERALYCVQFCKHTECHSACMRDCHL